MEWHPLNNPPWRLSLKKLSCHTGLCDSAIVSVNNNIKRCCMSASDFFSLFRLFAFQSLSDCQSFLRIFPVGGPYVGTRKLNAKAAKSHKWNRKMKIKRPDAFVELFITGGSCELQNRFWTCFASGQAKIPKWQNCKECLNQIEFGRSSITVISYTFMLA